MDAISLARKLIKIKSLSGSEKPMSDFLERWFKKRGLTVKKIPSSRGRVNIFAYQNFPKILLCTHIDTVPPYVSFRETNNHLWGRGACDTKGILATQLMAGEALIKQGNLDIGFLCLVGEEVDHRGAIDAAQWFKKQGIHFKAIIVGEPTENKCALATKGIVKVRLLSQGKPAHSAYPKLGRSAIHPLVSVLNNILKLKFPSHPVLGETTLNIGTLHGGTAANIFAGAASAEIMVRTVGQSRAVYKKIKKVSQKGVEVELQSINDPFRCTTCKGFPTTIVSFNTDLPYFKGLSDRFYLMGPGSILDAHKPDEKIKKSEIKKGVKLYQKLITELHE